VAELLAAGRRRPQAGLQERARSKLDEIEARIADLRSTAETLRAALAAGCDDLPTCAEEPRCPIPFTRAP
jgi:hypothetical protein